MANVHIILLSSIPNLGNMGDVVAVKPGYFRNFLYPQRRALLSTKENQAYFEEKRSHFEALYASEREKALALQTSFATLPALVCLRPVKDNGELYGAITPKDVLTALSVHVSHTLDIHQVQFPRAILQEGMHQVTLVLHTDVQVTLSCVVAVTEDDAKEYLPRVEAEENTSDA